MSTVEVRFSVRVPRLKSWHKVFVVGSEASLGRWRVHDALEMRKCPTDSDVWLANIEVDEEVREVKFRYFVGLHLDPTKGDPREILLVDKWEAFLVPRRCMPAVESHRGVARAEHEDVFGSYGGRFTVSDGWLSHREEHAVCLRIHGTALKFYKEKYKAQEHRLKVVPFDVRFREKGSVDEDGIAPPGDVELPDVPSFGECLLSVLTREDPIFGSQYYNGSVFRNGIDYLVFRTRTVALEFLGFRIELFCGSERVGFAYALPAALPDTFGRCTFPIISTHHSPIGQIDVDYMLVKSCEVLGPLRDDTSLSFGRHWTKRKTLEVGHRGMGSSYNSTDATSRENTIQSLDQAAKNGADYVEFDVQLTKDAQAVVYHDFHVLIEVARRKGAASNDNRHHQIAIKDLSLAQLGLLQLEHLSAVEPQDKKLGVTPAKEEVEQHHPFPTLAEVLRQVNKNVGFNVEVKYPMLMKDGCHECVGYFERNVFVDAILKDIYTNAGSRRIVFSSFDPDICSLIALKQHRYPVLFLVVGETTRYVPFEDTRSDCSRLAVNFAAGTGLLGVNFHSEELLKTPSVLDRATKFGLVKFVWGDDLNERENIEYFKRKLNVDGLIYDRIGEQETRQNIFVVEQTARNSLFSASPQQARREHSRTRQLSQGGQAPEDPVSAPRPHVSPRRCSMSGCPSPRAKSPHKNAHNPTVPNDWP